MNGLSSQFEYTSSPPPPPPPPLVCQYSYPFLSVSLMVVSFQCQIIPEAFHCLDMMCFPLFFWNSAQCDCSISSNLSSQALKKWLISSEIDLNRCNNKAGILLLFVVFSNAFMQILGFTIVQSCFRYTTCNSSRSSLLFTRQPPQLYSSRNERPHIMYEWLFRTHSVSCLLHTIKCFLLQEVISQQKVFYQKGYDGSCL